MPIQYLDKPEVISKHDIQDTYRIDYGIILIVNKYRRVKDYESVWLYEKDLKKNSKKEKGVKDLVKLTNPITVHSYKLEKDVELPAGTLILREGAVEAVTSPSDFRVELKFSGGAFSGSISDYYDLHNRVNHILEGYTNV